MVRCVGLGLAGHVGLVRRLGTVHVDFYFRRRTSETMRTCGRFQEHALR
jgi:hypothetical protein